MEPQPRSQQLAAGAHRAPLPVRARRSWTFAVAALCALLVLDGGPPASGAASADGGQGARAAAVAGVRADAPFDAAQIAGILRSWNPNLDDVVVGRIARAIERYSALYGLEPELVTAVLLVESSARPWAYSPKGAIGLMQVMPYMMDPLGLAGNPTTIESNIEAGCWILASNIRRLGEERGISAYFWGSDIRNLAYLEKVREAQARLRSSRPS